MVLTVMLVASIGTIGVLMTRKPPEEDEDQLGYTDGAVILNQDGPYEVTPPDEITLEYNGSARSKDGQNFECLIANARENTFDMYIGIYSDAALSDELYLSKLFRPGTGFENITLNRALEKGTHTCYLVLTQVEKDRNTIHNQIVVTINMIVD